jgi:putative ABC transport system permease protein
MIYTSNIKVAIRNARKERILSFAKLFGISISFAIILFAIVYVYYETSFDKCIPDNDKIYRCLMQGLLNGNDADFAVTSSMMADAVLNEIPEITEAVRLAARGNATIELEKETIDFGTLFFADSEVFEFFGFNIYKSIDDIFESENYIAIAKSVAVKYFNSVEGALNKVVRLRGENCVITGVFDDLPANFHLRTKIIQSIKDINPDQDGWGSQNYFTYIKTNVAGIDIDELNFKLTKTVYSHYDESLDGANAKNWGDLKYSESTYIFFNAEPLINIHFGKHRFDPAVTASKTYVYGAIILAILILLISSFNFINLTIANLSTRFKEIGIRKTNGAHNRQIAFQFILESVLFWIIGFGLAMLIYILGEESLMQHLGLEINIAGKVLIMIGFSLFVALILFNLASNVVPILFYSKKETLALIKKEEPVKRRFLAKDSFVILQFVLSALIILSSIFVQKQINFMVNKDRGYDTNNVITLSMLSTAPETRNTFIEEIKTHSAIQSVSTSDVYFGDDPSMNGAFFETQESDNYFHTSILPVDDEFLNTFNLKLIEGRFFKEERKSDFDAALLNETAVKEYKKSGTLIGKQLYIDGKYYNIIGIVKDFNYRSLYHVVQPLVLTRIENFGNVFVKVRNNQIPEALKIIRSKRKELNMSKPLIYEFHDEVIA